MKNPKWYKSKLVVGSLITILAAALGYPALAPTITGVACEIITCE